MIHKNNNKNPSLKPELKKTLPSWCSLSHIVTDGFMWNLSVTASSGFIRRSVWVAELHKQLLWRHCSNESQRWRCGRLTLHQRHEWLHPHHTQGGWNNRDRESLQCTSSPHGTVNPESDLNLFFRSCLVCGDNAFEQHMKLYGCDGVTLLRCCWSVLEQMT